LALLPGVRPAAADTTPTQDSVIGVGIIDGAAPTPFDIYAVSGPSGENATGHVNMDLFIGPFRGTVTGLCVNGYQAVVYGYPTVLPPGSQASGFVLDVDDRSAQNLGRDSTRLALVDPLPTSCPPFELPSPSGVTSGDIAVVDAPVPPTAPVFTMPPTDVTATVDAFVCEASNLYPLYTVTGVPTPTVTFSPSVEGPFALGSTFLVTATASNGVAPDASATFRATVVDQTPPVLTIAPRPPRGQPFIVVDATRPDGAVFTYTWTASDSCGPATVTLVSGPASGSVFPVGLSTVVLQADDNAGNSTQASLSVLVTGADDQLLILQLDVATIAPNSVFYKLVTNARDALARGKTAAACGNLQDFRDVVAAQSGKKLDASTATRWVTAAAHIRGALGC
jgi:hypothetical protein